MSTPVRLSKPDARGRFTKDLGLKAGDGGKLVQQRFYLGAERSQAEKAYARLDAVWDAVEERWRRAGRPTEKPLWSELTLKIARAVAAGKDEVTVAAFELPPALGSSYEAEVREIYRHVAELSRDFLMIRITLEEEEFAEDSKAQVTRERDALDKLLTASVQGGPMLHAALDQWGRRQAEKYAGRSEHGEKQVQRVEFLKNLLPDALLSSLTNDRIDAVLDTIAKRPATKRRGRPCSRDYAQSLVNVVRAFIDWLDGSELGLSQPKGYKVKPVTIVSTQEDRDQADEVPVYKRGELATIWAYCTPLERVHVALALNCGMGAGEIGTLQVREIHLASVTKKKWSYIKRLRAKTNVRGEWCLWPETVAAIEWYAAHVNSATSGPFVLVNGEPLKLTKGGNRSPYLRNMMSGIIDRIRKDRPKFRKLSFGKLKKSGATLVEQVGGPVLAKYHIAHGKATNDPLLRRYANRRFKRLFRVHRKLRKRLDVVFAVAEPFPPQPGRSKRPSLSLGKIESIKELRRQGVPYKDISERLGVSFDTIRRYAARQAPQT